jgi:hypothetical protein
LRWKADAPRGFEPAKPQSSLVSVNLEYLASEHRQCSPIILNHDSVGESPLPVLHCLRKEKDEGQLPYLKSAAGRYLMPQSVVRPVMLVTEDFACNSHALTYLRAESSYLHKNEEFGGAPTGRVPKKGEGWPRRPASRSLDSCGLRESQFRLRPFLLPEHSLLLLRRPS